LTKEIVVFFLILGIKNKLVRLGFNYTNGFFRHKTKLGDDIERS